MEKNNSDDNDSSQQIRDRLQKYHKVYHIFN